MSTGPGFLDSNNIWQFGEDDSETLMSDLLNKGQIKTSEAFTQDRARLDDLEDVTTTRHAEYTTSVSLANGVDGNVGTMTLDPAASSNTDFISLPSAGKVRLKAGLYAISTYVIWGASVTGLTLVGARVAAGPTQRSSIPNGSVDGFFSKANVFIAADDTDVTLYLFQVTGATRTVTGRVAITKLG